MENMYIPVKNYFFLNVSKVLNTFEEQSPKCEKMLLAFFLVSFGTQKIFCSSKLYCKGFQHFALVYGTLVAFMINGCKVNFVSCLLKVKCKYTQEE